MYWFLSESLNWDFPIGLRGSPGGSVVENLPVSAGDAGDRGLTPWSGRSPGGKMTIHSSILAWEIPWTDKPCWTQLSDWACTYTGGPMVKIPASTAGSTYAITGLWIKIPIPHAGAKSKIKIFFKSFGNLAYYSMCYIRTLSIFLEHLIFIIPLVFKILTHIIYWFYCGFNSSIICILQ